ncbi:MAG: Brp/Blh family beta-carotene 15,15'-dioxygenase, partial [Planctomycetota bacterium]
MPNGLLQLELLPWLIALVVLGMPHGAMDWLIIRKIDREQGRSRSLSVLTKYSMMMIAGGLLFALAPVLTCVLFLILTAIHWGAADLHAYQPLQSAKDRGTWWMLAIARGGLIIATPFALQPETAWQPFAALSGGSVIASPADVSRACLSLLTVCGLMLGYGWISGRLTHPGRFLAESAGVVAALAILPPLLAIGCYFLFVHAPRHCIRLHERR